MQSESPQHQQIVSWEPTEKGLENARRHLGKRLKQERTRADLTLNQAADVAGVSRATYGRFETGTAIIGYGPLRSLARFYSTTERPVKMMDLMPNEQYPAAPADPLERREWMRARNEAISRGLQAA